MSEITQENRILELETPLGKDVLLITELSGSETLSSIFRFEIKAFSEKEKVAPEDIIGKRAGVVLRLPSGEQRFFHGMVSRFGHTGQDHRTNHYQMQIVPWSWLLTRTTDCRIFQDKTVPEIIKTVFEDLKKDFPILVNYEDKTTEGRHRKLDYCVQYRETDLDFVSRLMEEEGIFYFFKHERNKHTLIFADSSSAFLSCKPGKKVVFKSDEKEDKFLDEALRYIFDNLVKGGAQVAKNVLKPTIKTVLAGLGWLPGVSDAIDKGVDGAVDGIVGGLEKLLFGDETPPLQEGIKVWREKDELQSGKSTLRDYHFEMPSKSFEVENPSVINVGNNSKLERYDHPGRYAFRFNKPGERLGEVEPEGRKLVDIRMQEKECQYRIIEGMSREGAFTAGHDFDLDEHPRKEFNGRYILNSVKHLVTQGDYFSQSAKDGGPYRNEFTCMPIKTQFRPPRKTFKPSIKGPQTAEVVGPSGEEIWVDKYGRVKVQFHWDREGKKNERSSCWLRVAQLWAGKQWGAIFIPRIGQEVIVDFLEGDPDQPIVVGSVYNAEQMPPYELPANKTQTGIKTRSSLNGTAENFNELRFEDKKGEEEVYLHAERNLTTEVEADESRTVGGGRTTSIGGDDSLTVGRNRSATIAAKDDETVGSNQTVTIGASQSISVGATISITAGGTVTITAPMITLNAGAVTISGVLTVGGSIVSPVYSPGVGNLV